MGRYVNIMAKVSPECAARIERVAKAGGFKSKYEVLQAAVALILKYADPGGEPAEYADLERTEELRELFGPIVNVRFALASVKPNGGKRVEPSEMIAFYGKETLMLRVQDVGGNISTTTNHRDVLEVVLAKTLPEISLGHLRRLKQAGGYPTLLAALMDALRLAQSVADAASQGKEIEDMFREAGDGDPRRVMLGVEHKPARAKSKREFK